MAEKEALSLLRELAMSTESTKADRKLRLQRLSVIVSLATALVLLELSRGRGLMREVTSLLRKNIKLARLVQGERDG